jgi:PAS domain S-box-containing protein
MRFMVNQREILKTAVEQGHLGLAELDATGHFVAANPAFLSMLGMRETELLGEFWHVSVHPEDRSRVEAAYSLARTAGRGYVEIRAVRTDQVVVYQALTVTMVGDAEGAFTGYRCLRHDISGYKRDQEALTFAVESAPNGLLMLDSAGKIQSANRAVERLFGYTRNELVGQPVEFLLPERLRVERLDHRDASSPNEATIPGRDIRGVRKDGVEIPLEVYLNRIETATGELTLCTVLDIAERVRHQEQLELAKHAAETANRAKSDFLARMSHEIRTPMNLIMGMNALLLNSSLNDKQRQQVEISYRNVRRLLRLINGILDLSKVEAGKLTLDAAPFDLNTVLVESSATMSSAIEQKGLLFELSVDPGAWRYWIGDAERLQQILLNLIGNSIKFTARGSIEVKVTNEQGPNGESGLRFAVSDTGCGIPADKAAVIFEAFQQAEGAMNRPYEGTGLGLSIAKTLVQMMSGNIWVEEKSDPGSRIVFTAFFQPTTEHAVEDHRSAASSATVVRLVDAGTRVLIVEDNPENVILLRAYLENVPLSLHFATNGVEAVAKRRTSNYDLILMDIQMPIMDGYTATREIRAWEKANAVPRAPILALTAHALSGARSESAEAGCDGHLTKPIERIDLVEAIAKFARRQSGGRNEVVPEPIAALRPAFLANRWVDLARMRDAMNVKDFATIRTIGHNCKGTGSGYGFPEISLAGAAIEQAARALDAASLEISIQQFESCIGSVSPKVAARRV